MENIFDIGNAPYEASQPTKKLTFCEKCLFCSELLIDIVKVLVLSIPHWLFTIYRLVVKPDKKSVIGQTVLVTGGGNGIGKEIAIQFAREGCNIAIADLDIQAAKITAKELNEANMKIIARAYHVDITDTEQINNLKASIERDMPPVDILINNAGIVPMLSLREGTNKEVERIIQVNVTAHIHVTRTFLPGMISRKRGHIVGLSSLSAIHPMGGAVIYSSTKGAMQNFIIALNEELRQEGNGHIKCTSILPYTVTSRKDLVDAVHFRFPLISPRYTAEIAVDATLRNELMVAIPRSYLWFTFLMNLLPFSIQMLCRDFILKEKGSKLFCKENKRKKL